MDNPQSLEDAVDRILALTDDPEAAHSEEDQLMRNWIVIHADDKERTQFLRLWNASFPRWSA